MKKWLILLVACTFLVPTVMANSQIEAENETDAPSCGLAQDANVIQRTRLGDNLNPIGGLGEPFYGYVAYDPVGDLPEGPCSFLPGSPDVIDSIAATTSESFISGATWANGIWYGCQYGAPGYTYIWTIDRFTGDMTIVGDYDPDDLGLVFNGLAFNRDTGTMYACSSTALYIINMETGASTLVGSFSNPAYLMIAIDFDIEGNLYGVELLTDSLYSINPDTGLETLIGYTSYDLNFAQDMAYDYDEEKMYLSAYEIMGGGGLFTCDLSTGSMTPVGYFKNAMEITGFAIPSGASIEIGDVSGGLGASIVIRNIGSEDAVNVTWSVSFSNAIILLPLGGTASKTIDSIPAGEDQIIKARFLGFGGILKFTDMIITVEADNFGIIEKTLPAKLALIFVII